MQSLLRRWRAASVSMVVVVLAAGVAAGCGSSSSDDSTTGGSSAGISTIGGKGASEAATAGTKSGTGLGTTKLPSGINVGVVLNSAASEGTIRTATGVDDAAKVLGWSTTHCDAKGTPEGMKSCFDTLINRKVGLIVACGVDASLVTNQLKRAQSADVPVYDTFVEPSPLLAADYSPSFTDMSAAINAFLFKKMAAEGGNTLAIWSSKAVGALRQSRAQLQKDLDANPSIKVVAENETDIADPVGSDSKTTREVLTAHPDVSALWASIDFDLPPIARTMRTVKGSGKKPLLVGFFGDKVNLDLIRQGLVTGLVESPLEANGWIAIDQAAEQLARGTKPSQVVDAKGVYPFDFLAPQIVDEGNVPPAGEYVKPKSDFIAFFTSKWAAEFGTGGGSSTTGQ